MDITNLKNSFHFHEQTLTQNFLNKPLTLRHWLFGNAQQQVSIVENYTTKYCVNEIIE